MNKHAHVHRQAKSGKQGWVAKDPSIVPQESQNALRKAMELEGISPTEFTDLLWIMAQESTGVMGVHNSASTARGLFQLLRAQYDLNPHGEQSFGHAVEECQGGIHYIMGRYHTAASARKFWEKHQWY